MTKVASRSKRQPAVIERAQWFAISTRFKCEKRVVALLKRKGVVAYLPTIRYVREYSKKKKTVDLPLINCYVFVQTTTEKYVQILETPHVLGFVRFAKDLVPIPGHEIDLLRRICREEIEVESRPLTFALGATVEIVDGNLTGVRGVLVKEQGKNFVVKLDYIGIGLHMEIDRQLLRPIGRQYDLAVTDTEGLWRQRGY